MIELAIAMFIIALLLGSILVPLGTQVEQRQIAETQKAMEEIKEALIGFAIANGRLPCPATLASNGLEGFPCDMATRAGYVPWATLGTPKLDAWGRIFRFSVTPAFASATPFSFATPTDITIQTRNPALPAVPPLVNLTNLNGTCAVIVSSGKNGYGGVNDQGIPQLGVPVANADETTNYTNATTPPANPVYVSRVQQGVNASGPGGEFDDIVTWLSPNILYNRMVAAGKLP